MNLRRGHVLVRDPGVPLGGKVVTPVLPLERLDEGAGRLSGQFVRVHNAAWLNEPGRDGEAVEPAPVGDARPDDHGDFLFDHGRGGPRVDKYTLRSAKYRKRYVEAAHF